METSIIRPQEQQSQLPKATKSHSDNPDLKSFSTNLPVFGNIEPEGHDAFRYQNNYPTRIK